MANPSWKPGVVTNPSGINNKVKALTNELRKQLAQNPNRLRTVVDSLITQAEEGNMVATAMIFARLEGAVPQTIDVNNSHMILNSVPEADNRIRELADRFGYDVPVLELTATENADDQG